MIFSLLNVRKKTAASLAGIAIGALCLWGVAMWQDISVAQLANILLAILLLLGGIMLAALLLISAIKVSSHLLKIAAHNRGDARQQDQSAGGAGDEESAEGTEVSDEAVETAKKD